VARTETVALGEFSGAISAAAFTTKRNPRRSGCMVGSLNHQDCCCRSPHKTFVSNYITGPSSDRTADLVERVFVSYATTEEFALRRRQSLELPVFPDTY